MIWYQRVAAWLNGKDELRMGPEWLRDKRVEESKQGWDGPRWRLPGEREANRVIEFKRGRRRGQP